MEASAPEPKILPVSEIELAEAKRQRLWGNCRHLAANISHDVQAGILDEEGLATILLGLLTRVGGK